MFRILEKIWPKTCIVCRMNIRIGYLCENCLADLPWNSHACKKCALPLQQSMRNKICGQCLSEVCFFDSVVAPFQYHDLIRHFITRLKFNHCLLHARLLGNLLGNFIKSKAEVFPELLIPVPLHPQRMQERGFNQAIEIAKTLQKMLKIPLDTSSCIRIKNTEAQSSLAAKHRQKNIKKAFKIKEKLTVSSVAIIDDVMTTGHTVNEIAKILKKSGVKKVDVWCCARA
jgi:ComF family protein